MKRAICLKWDISEILIRQPLLLGNQWRKQLWSYADKFASYEENYNSSCVWNVGFKRYRNLFKNCFGPSLKGVQVSDNKTGPSKYRVRVNFESIFMLYQWECRTEGIHIAHKSQWQKIIEPWTTFNLGFITFRTEPHQGRVYLTKDCGIVY